MQRPTTSTAATAGLVSKTPRAQFLHVEKYARRAPHGKAGGNDIWKIANEAERVDGFCPHVAKPLPPTLVFGRPPRECAHLAQRWAEQKFTPYIDRRTQAKKLRKYRQDQPCALVGVISAPRGFFTRQRWQDFKAHVVGWLKRKYGDDRLQAVVEHLDEPQPHLHFWVVPRSGEDFAAVHQGVDAEESMRAAGATRHRREAAYKSAMSDLQQEFFREVTQPFGLLRESVGGKRLSRAQLAQLKYERERREHAERKEREALAMANAWIEKYRRLAKELQTARGVNAKAAPPPPPPQSLAPEPLVRPAGTPQPARTPPTPFDDMRLPRRPKPF